MHLPTTTLLTLSLGLLARGIPLPSSTSTTPSLPRTTSHNFPQDLLPSEPLPNYPKNDPTAITPGDTLTIPIIPAEAHRMIQASAPKVPTPYIRKPTVEDLVLIPVDRLPKGSEYRLLHETYPFDAHAPLRVMDPYMHTVQLTTKQGRTPLCVIDSRWTMQCKKVRVRMPEHPEPVGITEMEDGEWMGEPLMKSWFRAREGLREMEREDGKIGGRD